MWMNRHEIELQRERRDPATALGKAARVLHALMEETDNHSNGWDYWARPSRAAEPLMKLLQRNDAQGASDAELQAALRPVRSFLTRYGDKAEMDRRRILAALQTPADWKIGDRVVFVDEHEPGTVRNIRDDGDGEMIYTVVFDNPRATPDGHAVARGFELKLAPPAKPAAAASTEEFTLRVWIRPADATMRALYTIARADRPGCPLCVQVPLEAALELLRQELEAVEPSSEQTRAATPRHASYSSPK